MRTIFKYVNFLVVVPVTIIYLSVFNPNLLCIANVLWFTLSITQALTKNVLIDFLLPRVSIVFGRNFALGFAPEPSYMAKTAIFFLIMVDYYRLSGAIKPFKAKIMSFMSFMMVLISSSLTGFILIIIYFTTKLILRSIKRQRATLNKYIRTVLLIISLILCFPILFNLFRYFSSFGKIGNYLSKIFEESLFILFQDPSFKSRFSSFIINFKPLVLGNMYGLGIPDFPTGSIFAPVYDSGVFGLSFTVIILSIMIYSIIYSKDRFKSYLVEIFVLFIFLTFSESMATSYIAFIVGIASYLLSQAKKVLS
jgi:hypothetical protein